MFDFLGEIRTSERRLTWSAFLVLFGVIASHAMLEAARDALFLAQLPPERLPWVYLGVAVITLALYSFQQIRGSRTDHRALCSLLGISSVITLAFWLLVRRPEMWILYALYMWPGVLATSILIRFWTLAGDLFSVGQAKRLYALIGAGSVLGAIFGSSMARVIISMSSVQDVLLGAAVMLLLTALGPVLLLPRPEPRLPPGAKPEPASRTRSEFLRPFRIAFGRPYLRRVGAMILVSTLAFTIVDYLFKSSVAQHVPADRLGEFFSTTYVILNTLSLVAQLFLVGWLVRIMGVSQVLAVLPVLIVLGTFGLIFGGGLVAAAILKGFDGTLRNSLHRTATEVLYVPLTRDVRGAVKGWIDVIGQRGGQAFASLLILLLVMMGWENQGLIALLLGLALVWIRIISSMESHYVNLFRETLQKVASRPETSFEELDLGTLETLLARLNSTNDNEVVAALDLLVDQERVHVIPALILYHPSCEVVLRALEIFARAGRDDVADIAHRLVNNPNAEIRAAAMRTLSWLEAPSPEMYESMTDDLSPIVRATALVGLVSFAQSAPAAVKLARMAREGSEAEKIALAQAIRWSPGSGYDDVLLKLAEGKNHQLQLNVIEAMHEVRSARFIGFLLGMLPFRDLRRKARLCLHAIGPDALAEADRVLGLQQFDINVRRQLPRVIRQFQPQEAASILMRHLRREGAGEVRYRVLRSLGRIRLAHPEVELDAQALRTTLEETLANIYQLIDWRVKIQAFSAKDPTRATEVQELILQLLGHKEKLARERLFRLLGLLYPKEDMYSVYRGAQSASVRLRDSSRELLEHLLDIDFRDPILSLLDDIPAAVSLRRAGRFHQTDPQTYEEVLTNLLEQGGVGMRAIVVYHVGELRLETLRDKVAMLPSDLSGMVSRTVDRTLAILDGAPNQKLQEDA